MCVAGQNGHASTIRCLCKELGAKPDYPKRNGATAIFMAAQNAHNECIKVMVTELGVCPDSPKVSG